MNRPEDIPERVWEEASEPASVVFDASVDLYGRIELIWDANDHDIRLITAIRALIEQCEIEDMPEHAIDAALAYVISTRRKPEAPDA